MAVSETKNPSALKIKLDAGLNDDGKTIVNLQVHDELEILKQDNTVLN